MIKQNKLKTVISTILILLPVLVGVILWDKLPETIATHFGANNEPNGFSSKAFAVFGIPSVMAALHLVCLVITGLDPKQKNIGKKPLSLVFYIIPIISLTVMTAIYMVSLGIKVNIGFICCVLIGVLFVVMGNILPKAKQNYTFGIKLPWTLNDTENWNKTHRLAGYLFVTSGAVILATSFLANPYILITIAVLAVAIPTVYSYLYYKKHSK